MTWCTNVWVSIREYCSFPTGTPVNCISTENCLPAVAYLIIQQSFKLQCISINCLPTLVMITMNMTNLDIHYQSPTSDAITSPTSIQ